MILKLGSAQLISATHILIGREERPPEEEGICSTGGSNGRAEVATCGLSANRE
jgi:hypothetical protein